MPFHALHFERLRVQELHTSIGASHQCKLTLFVLSHAHVFRLCIQVDGIRGPPASQPHVLVTMRSNSSSENTSSAVSFELGPKILSTVGPSTAKCFQRRTPSI